MQPAVLEVAVMFLCGVALGSCQTPSPDQQDQGNLQALVQGTNLFSQQLYQVLSSEPGNLVVSPLSVQTVLAMAWLGAGGTTASQLAAGLQLPASRQQVETGFKTLLGHLQGDNNTVILDIANKMYARKELKIKETFRTAVVNSFNSDAQELDFYGDTDGSRRIINQWVEDRTRGKIRDLIAEGSLDQSTLMVLVNAIYFKGSWVKPFDEDQTTLEPFYLTAHNSVKVNMMHKSAYFNYGSFPELGLKALEMRYQGSDALSMLLLLPTEVDGLPQLEAGFGSLNLSHIVDDLWKSEVVVSLPRFKIEKKLELVPALSQLGIHDVFAPGADLSGITSENAFVSKVVQKAFIEVTEKGTEAAAATEMEIVPYSLVYPTPEFKADHPFLFLILHRESETVLFLGRVASPS